MTERALGIYVRTSSMYVFSKPEILRQIESVKNYILNRTTYKNKEQYVYSESSKDGKPINERRSLLQLVISPRVARCAK